MPNLTLSYVGRLTLEDFENKILGPDLNGTTYVAADAKYLPSSDRTLVTFEPVLEVRFDYVGTQAG